MGFLFPFFLLAGLAIVIPIIIHLVNLRRYKRELFPNIRFLRSLQISSKKSAQLRRRWLLLTRILFLLALVLAFSHPYLNKANKNAANISNARVVYIDNSYSMSALKDGQPLFAFAKNRARQLVKEAAEESRFVIVSNDQLFYSTPLNKQQAIKKINDLQYSHQSVTLAQIKDLFLVREQENLTKLKQSLYMFSDFQAATLQPDKAKEDSLKNVIAYLFPIKADNHANIFIDSVRMIYSDSLHKGERQFKVSIARSESRSDFKGGFRMIVDGKTRFVRSVNFQKGDSALIESLDVPDNGKEWTKVEWIVSGDGLTFDDTFRLAAHMPAAFSALIIAKDGKLNPYLQAAFNSMANVKRKVISPSQVTEKELNGYSLIVVQNGAYCDSGIASGLKSTLEDGSNVLIFPGQKTEPGALNNCLKKLEDIRLGAMDTTQSQVVELQKEHPLVKNLFTEIPEQLQLPVAYRHFPVSAGLSANRQDILSFADGSPLLTSFNFDPGKLYLCTAPIEGEGSNFPLSYFFAPLLYRMTVPESASSLFMARIGSDLPLWIPVSDMPAEGEVWRLFRGNKDWVPPQKISGRGLGVYVGKTVDKTGFYLLKQGTSSSDSIWVGVNSDPAESILQMAETKDLEQCFKGANLIWLNAGIVARQGWQNASQPFPLWKVCLIIALICLLIETWFLIQPPIKQVKSK